MHDSRKPCEEIQILLMGLIDNELSNEQEEQVSAHLATCAACKKQYESFKSLKEGALAMRFKDYPEMHWDEYWQQVYNRIERGVAWIFISIGSMILLAFAGFRMMEDFFLNPEEPLLLKVGVGVLSVGLIVLLVSIVREKWMVRKIDKYRRVER